MLKLSFSRITKGRSVHIHTENSGVTFFINQYDSGHFGGYVAIPQSQIVGFDVKSHTGDIVMLADYPLLSLQNLVKINEVKCVEFGFETSSLQACGCSDAEQIETLVYTLGDFWSMLFKHGYITSPAIAQFQLAGYPLFMESSND